MHLRIQSYPPLGEVTTISPTGLVQFTVILEVPKGQNERLWEVEVWSSVDSTPWAGKKANFGDPTQNPVTFRSASNTVATLHYSTTLHIKADAQFTLRLRRGHSDVWSWARDVSGFDDGYIVVQSPETVGDAVLPLPDLSSEWRISERTSQSPGTKLWSIETDVSPADDDASSLKNVIIGKPWGSFHRWFALVRHNSPWLGPRHGKDQVTLDKDAIMCSFQSTRGQHVVLLAVTKDNFIESVLQSHESGGLQLHVRSDNTEHAGATVLVSLGNSFDSCIAAVMYEARNISLAHSADLKHPELPPGEAKPAWKESWADGLGYCTWNALGTNLTDEKLCQVLDDFSANGVKISNLIIDDGWQSVTNGSVRGWKDFEASNMAFPDGLKATVSKLRTKFPEIDRIAVWHAIIGYWGGISMDGRLAEEYETIEVQVGQPYQNKMHLVSKSDIGRLYNDFYRFLNEAGIDSVKTDVQHVLGCLVNAKSRRDLITSYLDAWTISSLRYFDSRAISCMSQFPQGIFHSHLRQNHAAFVVRNSDDYFPDIPASHMWHIWANAHNNLMTRYLNVIPDWDMFQTKHEYAWLHAAARCVSGGPIYITDVPGEHDLDLIKSISGVTIRGKTVVFRPSVVGRSLSAYTRFEDGHLLKIGSYHGPSGTGSPILGIFNTAQRPAVEIIPLSSFTGAVPMLEYVVYSYSLGMVSPRLKCGDQDAVMAVSLDVKGFDVLTATPLARFPGDRFRHIWIGNLGLLDKMTGCAAVVSTQARKMENKRLVIGTSVKAFGILGIWISTLPEMSIDGDFMVMIQEEPVPRHVVRVSKASDCVLELDLEAAWKEMGLRSRWSNEIQVKVYFST